MTDYRSVTRVSADEGAALQPPLHFHLQTAVARTAVRPSPPGVVSCERRTTPDEDARIAWSGTASRLTALRSRARPSS
ncbi:hypothetical protein [Kushneria avicenniae]|uniref:hypothetical protein n=1 Tax=Kushneria avicenniae TaxID=402385 RepID=UPI001113EFB0|nr:hypothetical protein [Kushneria avicenniae]